MPHDLVVLLVSAVAAVAVGILALAAPGDWPRLWLRRFALPILWVASREPRSTFAEFSRRTFSKRELFLAIWFLTFVITFTLLEFAYQHVGTTN